MLLEADAKGKAFIRHPEDCWGCAACVKACPVEAAALYLAAEAGGRGGKLSARKEGALLHWKVTRPDGASETIIVNSQNANSY
jgi:adenylylsulfate reductase subunit B